MNHSYVKKLLLLVSNKNVCTCVLQNRVTEYIPLDPLMNKTGDVWHVLLKGDFKDMLYGYTLDGKFSPENGHYYDSSRILLDPYAKVSGYSSLFI